MRDVITLVCRSRSSNTNSLSLSPVRVCSQPICRTHLQLQQPIDLRGVARVVAFRKDGLRHQTIAFNQVDEHVVLATVILWCAEKVLIETASQRRVGEFDALLEEEIRPLEPIIEG